MPVIIIEGCEKAGKSTLINELVQQLHGNVGCDAERVHWVGRAKPDDRIYSDLLREHSQDLSKVWIWDRGWPSEYVYGTLLGQDRRLALDPWLGEWLHGRAVQVTGVRVILRGPHFHTLEALRDSSDLNVSPREEQATYTSYGMRFGWRVLTNEHTQQGLDESINTILAELFSKEKYVYEQLSPPKFAGPLDAKIAVVGEKLSDSDSWLPFTSYFGTLLGREFGDDAFKVLWTNASTCDPQLLRDKEIIITCGKIANEWSHREVKGGFNQKIISIPHPSYLYRFNDDRARQQLEYVRQVIQSLRPL